MSNAKIWMKSIVVLCSLFILFWGACGKDDTEVTIKGEDGQDPPLAGSTEIESLNLGDADNLFYGDNSAAPVSSRYNILSSGYNLLSSSQNSGLMTIDASGDIKPITMTGGNKKKFSKSFKIRKKNKADSKIKAALEFRDEDTGKLEWHVIDKNDKAHKLPKGLLVSHRLKNAHTFHEHGKLYYLDVSNDLMEMDISDDASQDKYNIVRSGVEQAVMDTDGNWLLALTTGRVVHRDASGDLETRMNGHIALKDNAENNKFFMSQGQGFLYFGEAWVSQWGVFFRAFLDQGELQVVSAQANSFMACSDADNTTPCPTLYFYPYRHPETCAYQAVGAEELLICNDDKFGVGYVYSLGDASHDMKEINFNWAGQGGGIAVASSNFLYYYSNEATYNGARLTRIDVDNTECRHLFSRDNTPTCPEIVSNTEYIIDRLTASDDDTIRFCGRRVEGNELGEGQLLLVEIVGADTATPLFRETPISVCNEISNL